EGRAAEDEAERRRSAGQLAGDQGERAAGLGGGRDVGGGEAAAVGDQPERRSQGRDRERDDREPEAMDEPPPAREHRNLSSPTNPEGTRGLGTAGGLRYRPPAPAARGHDR